MGKVSPKEKRLKVGKGGKQLRSSGKKYLKPGTLAQLRCNKALGSGVGVGGEACNVLGKRRVTVLRSKKSKKDEDKVFDESPLMLSPVNLIRQSSFVGTPKTPQIDDCQSDSRLESLSMDLLVKLLCHLHHDQLKPVFHVSQRIRKAVIAARLFHFNYTTPDRSRQELLSTMTPRPSEHWPFLCIGDGKGVKIPSPHTPKAPRHGPRPPSRLKVSEMRQVTTALFQESTFPARCLVPSVIPKPLCKTLASNRTLFCEEELCKAVAQNKLK